MKLHTLLPLTIISGCMVACQQTTQTGQNTQNAPVKKPEPIKNSSREKKVDSRISGWAGLTETAAVARARREKKQVRIVSRDGVYYPTTRDFRPERINLTVIRNRVVAVANY